MRPVIVIAVLAAVAIAAAVALRYGAGRLDGAVAATIERYGGAVTGTDVAVGSVDLALTAGRAESADITVGNPKGYETDYAVRIGRADVAVDIGSLAGDVPIIDELTLDEVLINAEQRALTRAISPTFSGTRRRRRATLRASRAASSSSGSAFAMREWCSRPST